ncbi:HlyD family secretion protein [Stenotrophomonas humi]
MARRDDWLGGLSVARPLNSWFLVVLSAAVAILILGFICFGTYTRRSTVTGQLVPVEGLVTVLSPATGVVSWLDVPEGARVTQGGALAQVNVPRATRAGDMQDALAYRLQQREQGLLVAQRAQHARLKVQSLGVDAQLQTGRHELAQIENEVATRQRQIRIANETLQRLRRLEDGQYVSMLQIQQQETTVLDYSGQMQALQRQATSIRRLVAQLEQAQRELPEQRRENDAGYQRELAQLEQERLQIQVGGALIVNAPVAGLVASEMVKPGQAVQAGQPLLSLLPGDGRLEVQLQVPSRAIGFVAPGDKVLLRYQSFPHQKFGLQSGHISTISRSASSVGQTGQFMGDSSQGEPFYRVTVRLKQQFVVAYGKAEPLKPGMLLEADVMGERRRLIEWIFEPLYSLRGHVSS